MLGSTATLWVYGPIIDVKAMFMPILSCIRGPLIAMMLFGIAATSRAQSGSSSPIPTQPTAETQAKLDAASKLTPSRQPDAYTQAASAALGAKDYIGYRLALSGVRESDAVLGNTDAVTSYLLAQFDAARKGGDQRWEATVVEVMGELGASVYENTGAIQLFEKSLTLWTQTGDLYGQFEALSDLGIAYRHAGTIQKSLDAWLKALHICHEIPLRISEARTLINVGLVENDLGKKQEALDHYSSAITIYKELGDIQGEAEALNDSGMTNEALGQTQKALDSFTAAIQLQETIGNQASMSRTLSNIGTVYVDLKEYEKALGYFDQALAIAEKIANQAVVATTLNNLGSTYSDLGRWPQALDYFNRAFVIDSKISAGDAGALALANMGETYAKAGDLPNAIVALRKGLSIATLIRALPESSPDRLSSLVASINANYADVLVRQGKASEAESYYRAAAQLDPRYATTGKDSPTSTVAAGDQKLVDPHVQPHEKEVERGGDSGSARAISLKIDSAAKKSSPSGLSFRSGKRYALIVGTDEYSNGAFRHLNNPVLDAKALDTTLREDYGFETTLLLNKNKDEIWNALGEVAKKEYGAADELVVFFAGHGDYDDVSQHDGMIVCTDTKPSKEDPSFSSYISDSALARTLNHLPVRHILVILDVCFGGAFDKHFGEENGDVPRGPTGSEPNNEAVLTRHVDAAARFLITSGGTEEVFDGPPGQHSKFMFKLLQVLAEDVPFLTYEDLIGPLSHLEDPHPQSGYFGGQPEGKFVLVHK